MRAAARSPRRRASLSTVVAAVSISPALAVVACGGGDGGPTEPEPDPDPGTGSIEVTTSTSGAEPDPDGYTVAVDEGEGRTIGAEDTLLVEGLQEGDHTVELSNLAENCLARIAFTSDRDGDSEIYVMGTDGSDPTNLTRDDGIDSDPAWSPRSGSGPVGASDECLVAAP